MDDPVVREWLSLKEAAAYSGFSRDTIYEATLEYRRTGGESGLLAYQRRPGAQLKVRVGDLDAWMMGRDQEEDAGDGEE